MRLRFTKIEDGPGPSEMLIGVSTVEGRQEEVVIARASGQGGTVDIGSALIEELDRLLVELPRESIAGRWRVWVPRSAVIETTQVAAAE